ncbi:MAG: transposase [candidate division WOR-3 bacterium]
MAELARIFTGGDEDTVCLMDPTYLRETEERLLVFAVYDEFSGKAIPLWWVYQEWETLRRNPPLSANLLVERAVRKLRELLGHTFILVADREFPSQRFRAKLMKAGIGYVIRLRENSSPPAEGEHGITYQEKEHKEPWNLVSRKEANPVKAYKKRMRIEHLFRDLKGLFGMREVLRRIRDPVVRKGLITLIMLAWLLAFLRGLYALVKGLLSQDDPLVREFLRGYISINLGDLTR